jgi:hypothetical protein
MSNVRRQESNMKWQMWRVSLGPSGVPDGTRSTATYDAYEKYKAYRAEVIEGATYVEHILETVLCDAIAGKDEVLRRRLKSVVFAGEAFTFFQKWRSLRTLLKESPNWLSQEVNDSSQSLANLHKCIADRNKFAHGELATQEETLEVELRYFESSEQTVKLTDEFIAEVMLRMQNTYFWLEGLHLDFYGYKAGA